MASRPFSGVLLHVINEKFVPPNPSPIALEPCHNGKAAVLTLLIKLPTGESSIPPSGEYSWLHSNSFQTYLINHC